MRNYETETKRIHPQCAVSADAHGIVYGNSGGKDSALVGILCKMACNDTVAIAVCAMPTRSTVSSALSCMHRLPKCCLGEH